MVISVLYNLYLGGLYLPQTVVQGLAPPLSTNPKSTSVAQECVCMCVSVCVRVCAYACINVRNFILSYINYMHKLTSSIVVIQRLISVNDEADVTSYINIIPWGLKQCNMVTLSMI